MNGDLNWSTNLSSHATSSVVAMQSYRQARSNAVSIDWKDRVYGELKALSIASQSDGSEFDEISALRAEEFIRDLPWDVEAPSLAAEENGSMLVEWYKKPRGEAAIIFSVVLGRRNYIYSLLKNGVPASHGALDYSEESLEMILSPLRKYFGIVSHARLKA